MSCSYRISGPHDHHPSHGLLCQLLQSALCPKEVLVQAAGKEKAFSYSPKQASHLRQKCLSKHTLDL